MMRNFARFVVCLLVLGCAAAGAQTRIPIRPEPKPGQTIHVTSTQAISISLEGAAAGQSTAPLLMTEESLSYSQTNGRFDDQGRMESQLAVEHFDIKQSINGVPKSISNIPELVGGSLTAVFDRGGKLLEVKVPKDLEQASSILKQLVAGAYGLLNLLPATGMSVGESETVPSTIPLRLPGSKTSVPYQTRTVTTLRFVELNGGNHIAHFDQRIESAGQTDVVKVSGTGKIDVNLDRGFVSASTTEWTFTGDAAAMIANAAGPQPGMVSGVIKVAVAAHE